ncbi:MAG TPA: class I SAM-dependent methyltransferase [Propionibacteriaceae bacterium]|nr:class I SAM-dependent methyltransferase [Propionibacteriaceae bacterium]
MSDTQARQRPEPFTRYTTPEFWNDPHISEQMLSYHLDPVLEPASRAHSFIERSVAWLVPVLGLTGGSRLLDLGCGPGLYANRIAALGVEVVGIDVSRRSLEHARVEARTRSLPSVFREGSYLDCELGEGYDAAILIYEDYCALSPAQREALLGRTRAALRPGGRLLFDVTAPSRFAEFHDAVLEQPNLMDGFWAQPPYLGTQETWTYPDLHLVLQRYTIETGTRTREFWNWMHCLSPDEVSAELAVAGFGEPRLFGDVAGAPYAPSAPTFAVLTSRA